MSIYRMNTKSNQPLICIWQKHLSAESTLHYHITSSNHSVITSINDESWSTFSMAVTITRSTVHEQFPWAPHFFLTLKSISIETKEMHTIKEKPHEHHGVPDHRPVFAQQFVRPNIKAPRNCPFVMGMHRWPLDSHHKGTVTQKTFPCRDFILQCCKCRAYTLFKITIRHSTLRTGGRSMGCLLWVFWRKVEHIYHGWRGCTEA